jgi:hypothetical protein
VTILPPRPGPEEPPSFAQFKVYEYDTAMGTSAWMAWERRYLRKRLNWLENKHEANVATLLEADRLAEAGLCQFSAGGKHAFLKAIRRRIAEAGYQGGLTEAKEMTDGKAEARKSDV